MMFKGTIRRRSTAPGRSANDAPGESQVFKINSKRIKKIKAETGWESVFHGTLNLDVAEDVAQHFATEHPLFCEWPHDIRFPWNPELPKDLKGYRYFLATAAVGDKSQEVLVRIPGRPFKNSVELVAPVKLRDYFGIDEGTEVTVICDPISN